MTLRRPNWPLVGTAIVLAVVSFACNGDNPADPVDPLDVRVFPSHVFAGGEVFLAGDWYRDSTRTFVLSADTFTLAVRRVDDSTIAATLPSSENGAIQLEERIAGADIDRGTLQVHGLVRSAGIQMPIEAEFTPSRNPALPYVITGDSAGVSVIDLRADQATRYPGIGRLRYEGSGCHRIAGPRYQDGSFFIWDTGAFPSNQQATRWQLIPDTVRQGPIPPWQGSCGVAEISPMVYVHTGSEGGGAFVSVDSIDNAGNATHFYDDILIGNKGFFWSGNRMVLKGLNHLGVGVIELQSRTLAYRVTAVNDVYSAAFSLDGQVIFLCGQGSSRLISVAAATGDSLESSTLACWSLATDPASGLLYATVNENSSAFVVVLDPVTLAQIGKIALPSTTCIGFLFESVLFADRTTSELILITRDCIPPDGVQLVHLSLPPVP